MPVQKCEKQKYPNWKIVIQLGKLKKAIYGTATLFHQIYQTRATIAHYWFETPFEY